MLKLTINKPAFDAFLAGDDVVGIKIRLQDGVLQFRPALQVEDTDVAPIGERSRGGVEVRIEGLWQDAIYDALDNPSGNPFFILQRAGQGWISAIPHKGEPKFEPPRTMPVMRVWAKKKVPVISAEQMERVADMPVPNFVEEVRRAKKNVDSYYARRRPGRPPREIADQIELIRLVIHTAVEIMDVKPLMTAQNALAEFASSLGVNTSASPAARRPAPAAPQKKKLVSKSRSTVKERPARPLPTPAPSAPARPLPAPPQVPSRMAAAERSPLGKRRREFEFA